MSDLPTTDRGDYIARAHLGGALKLAPGVSVLTGEKALAALRRDARAARSAIADAIEYSEGVRTRGDCTHGVIAEYVATVTDLISSVPGAALTGFLYSSTGYSESDRQDYSRKIADSGEAMSHDVLLPHLDGGFFFARLDITFDVRGCNFGYSTGFEYASGDEAGRRWFGSSCGDESSRAMAVREWVGIGHTRMARPGLSRPVQI